jgi:transposase
MFLPAANTKVYLALESTDMRKSINGLSILVSEYLELDPFTGHLFAFCNRKRNMVKILYWDRNGFCLWHKRLEKHTFKWPASKSEIMAIGRQELNWLLDGLEIAQKDAHPPLEYSTVF